MTDKDIIEHEGRRFKYGAFRTPEEGEMFIASTGLIVRAKFTPRSEVPRQILIELPAEEKPAPQPEPGDAVRELAKQLVLSDPRDDTYETELRGVESLISAHLAPLITKARAAEKYHRKRCEQKPCTVDGLGELLTRWQGKAKS